MRFHSKLFQRRAAAAEATPTLKKIYDVYMAPDGRFAASEHEEDADIAKRPTATKSSRAAGNRCLPKK
jgi:hypothetical protein